MSVDHLQGFWLGPWKVEPLRGAVTGPQGETRHLEPKVMDVFVCLVEYANEPVPVIRQMVRRTWIVASRKSSLPCRKKKRPSGSGT